MAYNKSADGSSMKKDQCVEEKKSAYSVEKTMSLITKIQTN